jgi:predicted transcriptional regulator
MSSPVLTLPHDAHLIEAARFLLDHRLSGAPVLDGQGKPIGVLSFRDLAKFFLDPWLEQAGREGPKSLAPEPLRIAVSELMHHGVVSVKPEATTEEIRRAMRQHKVHRVLVQDAKGVAVGVVSASDLALRGAE